MSNPEQNPEPSYKSRNDLNESGSEQAYGGWRSTNHIQVGINLVARVARTRPPRERDALLWLANYAHREQLTADTLTDHLQCERADIRAALTNPTAGIKHIVSRIESLRAIMDAKLRDPADTAFSRLIKKACRYAMEKGVITEVIAKTRMGKTQCADAIHLRNLHRAIYVSCPATESYSDWIFALGRAAGVSVGGGKRVTQIEAQLRSMFGKGAFNFLLVDEGHYLWPTDITLKPKRVEFLRSLWDENKGGVGITVLSTPQALLSANQATAKSKRWAPGQWEGRVVRFSFDEAIEEDDHYKVAKWHCPEGDKSIHRQLVIFAKITPGFYGQMVNALELARFEASEAKTPLTAEIVRAAQKQMIKGTELEKALKEKGISL
jgi:hypothetical protein